MEKRRLQARDYTVGWICALPIELAAAQGMLDEEHESPVQDSLDHNLYTLGRIGDHNVVITCLPAGRTGTQSAATVATRMLSKFKSIRFGLLVGIGGGVPSTEPDIRLGDVVISQPYLQHGGVVQYDFGKTGADGHKERTGWLNAPPAVLLNAASKLRALHYQGRNSLATYLSALDRLENFRRDAAGPDVLFEATYNHVGGPTCERCSRDREVKRTNRTTPDVVVHYGTIASGNQVIKDGITRDKISAELGGVMCFEMEAAGLMNDFPCLVIRGVCDYADSHKNKRWQPYAAATAAACAKGILSMVHATTLAETASVVEAEHQISGITTASEATGAIIHDIGTLLPDDPLRFLAISKRAEWNLGQEASSYNIFEHISDYEPDRTYRDHLRSRCQGTTGWIIDHKQFRAWLEKRSSQCLWLTVGCGKTLVTSAVLEHVLQKSQKNGDLVAHFFYSHSNKSRLKADHLFRSYIKQILGHIYMMGKPCPSHITSYVKRFYGPKALPPSFDEIVDEVFLPLSRTFPNATYLVDGLDECEIEEVRSVLKTFRRMLSQRGVKLFISGRESLDVTKAVQGSFAIRISNDNVKADLRRFIERKIEEKMQERRLTEKESVLQDIKTKLNERADRMILWVSLQIDTLWEDCFTDKEIQTALMNLPKDLNETYERCLTKMNAKHSNFSSKILRWVCAAIKPFKIEQLREALAINTNSGRLDRDRLPSADIIKLCSNLVIQDRNDQVLLAHHSVRQFLLARAEDTQLFPDGFDLESTELELGQLCVVHLTSPDYALALQSSNASKGPALTFDHTTIEKLRENMPFWVPFALPKHRAVQITLPRKTARAPPPATELPSFFQFAKEQWAPLTHGIVKYSDGWSKFRTLALEPHSSWRFHPWPPLGESLDSHYSGLLGWAIVNQHLALLDLLLDLQDPKPKADIFNIPFYHYDNLPALHLASRAGNAEITRRLLQVCDVKKVDNIGRTALHHAAEVGNSYIAMQFIRRGVSVKARNAKGQTALHLATENGHEGVVRRLIEKGAEIDMKDNNKRTALFMAARNGHDEIVRMLLELGADINMKDIGGWTALFAAAERWQSKTVRALVEQGADIHAKDNFGGTALDIAMMRASAKLDADAETEPLTKRIALLMAVRLGDKEKVRMLLQLGVDVDVEDDNGWTALHLAMASGHDAVAELLLESSANFETLRLPISFSATLGNTGPTGAGNSVPGNSGHEETSIFQISIILMQRLRVVPGFQQYLEEEEAADDDVDPITILWRTFRRGHSLMTIYNALNPNTPLEVDRTRMTEKRIAQDASFKFIQACLRELKFSTEECFTITDLYGDNTTGFTKVAKCVNRVLDILEQVGIISSQQFQHVGRSGDESAKKQSQREHIIEELIKTERTYVHHLEQLHSLKQLVEERIIIPGDAVHDIFLNLNALLDFQRRFLVRAEQVNALPSEEQNWGRLFVLYKSAFQIYEPYITNKKTCGEVIVREYGKIKATGGPPDLQHIVESRGRLMFFLLKPFQRLLRYRLLLKNLLDKGDLDEERKDAVSMGLEATKSIFEIINLAMDHAEAVEAVEELKRVVQDWKGHRIETFGDLVLFGTYPIYKDDGSERKYAVYLFEAILLFCKEVEPTKKGIVSNTTNKSERPIMQLKGRIFMQNITETVSISNPGRYPCQIFWKGDNVIENAVVCFPTEQEAMRWASQIDQQRKAYSEGSSTISSSTPSKIDFDPITSRRGQHELVNPYAQYNDDDSDVDEDEPDYLKNSVYTMGSNGLSTTLRFHSATEETRPAALPPAQFPLNAPMPSPAPFLTLSDPPLPIASQLKIRVICPLINGTMTLVVHSNISFESLRERIDAKLQRSTNLSLISGQVKLKFLDEGDYVSIQSDEDVQNAFETWNEQHQADQSTTSQLGEIELYCLQ